MTRRNEYDPTENDLTVWCIDYLKQYGLNFSAHNLIDYFVEARIFERCNDRIRFRLRMFFGFFAATRMIDSVEFKEYVLAEERYLCFINEIGFYSALNRRDKIELDRIAKRFESLTETLWPVEAVDRDPNKYLKEFLLPGKKQRKKN